METQDKEAAARRNALVQDFIGMADSLGRRFHRRFPDLIDRDDAIQTARLALVNGANHVEDKQTAAAYLKLTVEGGLKRYLRDHARLVRVPRREHEKGTHAFRHSSLDAVNEEGRAWLDTLPAPEGESNAAEALPKPAGELLATLPENEAAVLQRRVIEGETMRQVAAALGISHETVARREKKALAKLRDLLQP